MALSIKHEETEQLSRKLASLTGETLTEAIRVSVEERYERVRRSRASSFVADELRAIAVRCAKRPIISEMSADEILGYDDLGVPTR
jgi:antitoxin VapB